MNKLIKNIESDQNLSVYTENGAITNASSLSHMLDFFGTGAALRKASKKKILSLFRKAFAEDPLLALKCLFYFRNCRGGQGERNVFRVILKWLGEEYPHVVQKNYNNIVTFGRWDDLYALEGTQVWDSVLVFMGDEWNRGFEKGNSLIFKWLPSVNTSSKETCRRGKEFAKFLGMSEKEYRQTLSHMRKNLDVVEVKMCANDWTDIEYKKVPSKAALNYRHAFKRHDEKRYTKYIEDVASGKEKVNASVLYPYEIVSKSWRDDSKTLDVLWKNLPNYLEENPHNGIVVADVSGSMNGRPMEVSISLAIYFAERNKGQFHNKFITFSENPKLVSIVGNNIREKVQNLSHAEWGGSTNLQAVFDLILTTGLKYNIPQKDMPDTLYIVSDMEFNVACEGNQSSNYQIIRQKYYDAGYKQPNLVFWNVDSRNIQFPITKDDRGTCLVSGCSPAILKSVLSAKEITPVDVMLETLNSETYNSVVL